MSKDKQPHKNEIGHLKELIVKSGFPLQIEISSSLAEHFTAIDEYAYVSTSAFYLNKDEEKGRELDIKAKIPIASQKGVGEGRPMIFLNLLIQCKNIPGNAWVFFKSPHRVTSTCKSTSVLDALEWAPPAHAWFTRLNGLHLEGLPITTVYHEFVLDKDASNKRDDNLFEAVITLAKATSYESETLVSSYEKMLESLSEEEWPDLNYAEIFYSAVVFNGKMYVAEEVEKGRKMSLTPVDHVGLLVDYVSGSYDIELVVDILHKRAFERFVKKIIKDMEIWQNALDSGTGIEFNKEILKALKWYTRKGGGV